MCGLAGLIPAPAVDAKAAVRAMSARLRHRGPDDEGLHTDRDGRVVLGHRRLSIIDLSDASHQPMVDDATGVALAYNGEVYNFRALRKELEAEGHRFRSSGDTEVVLRAWLAWGPACVARFAGMFAFALWDPRSATLHLVRDAMGIKPLYWTQSASGFVFASEARAFGGLPGFSFTLDPAGLAQYLEFGYVFDATKTIFQDVQKVEAGTRIEVRDGRVVRTVRWFEPPRPDPMPDDEASVGAAASDFGRLFEAVVAEHLIADVPVGLLLSGGLDSSLVAAFASRHADVTAVTMAFIDSDVDERPQARAVVAHLGLQTIEVEISPGEVQAEIVEGAAAFDDLFADWGSLTSRLLYRRCRERGLKVVLVGEGSDELFGGYDIFRQPQRLGPLGLWHLYRRYCGRRWGRLWPSFRRVMGEYLDVVGGEPFAAVRLFESRRQLPNQYVMKVDKGSMAESVEARTPFLDRRVAEFAYRLPRSYLDRGGENKHLLRRVARNDGLLPRAIADRAKFGAPLAADWMDTDRRFRAQAREMILAEGSLTRRIGFARPMRAYFDRRRPGDPWPMPLSIHRNLAWRLLLLEHWAGHYPGVIRG